MTARALSLVCALTAIPLSASASGAPELSGVWMRGDGNARVRIAPCGSNVCATNLWIRDPSKGEAVGDQLVMTLTKQGEGSYSGSARDSKRGWNLSMKITMAGANRFTSNGCVLGQVLCRSVTWTAVK